MITIDIVSMLGDMHTITVGSWHIISRWWGSLRLLLLLFCTGAGALLAARRRVFFLLGEQAHGLERGVTSSRKVV